MSKILLFSDIHLHAFPQFAKEEVGGVNSRLLDGLDILDQIADYVESHEDIIEVIFGGDLFHVRNNIAIPTYNKILDSIVKFNKRLLERDCYFTLITGNHDQSNKIGASNSLEVFKHLKHYGNMRYFDSPTIDSLHFSPDVKVGFIPYSENKEMSKMYLSSPCDIKIAHLGIHGSEIGADFVYSNENDYRLEDLALEETTATFLGHFHKHQELAPNCWYIGAPLQHNTGDEGQVRGFMTYDLSTNESTHIRTNYPEFVSLDDSTIEHCLSSIKGNYIRVSTKNATKTKKILEKHKAKAFQIIEESATSKKKERASKPSYVSIKEAIPAYINNLETDLDKNKLISMCNKYVEND